MWCYRKMFKTKWVAKVWNEDALIPVRRDGDAFDSLIRRARLVGYVLRDPG